MKRVFLFIFTNIAVLIVLSIVLNLLGVNSILDERGVGLDLGNLLVFCAVFGNERGLGMGYFVTSIAAQIVFGILASTIVMWFSRQREFRADAGGARLAGTPKMISALEALKSGLEQPGLPQQMSAFGISGGAGSRFGRLFMSHPPLDERIHRLKLNG